MSDNTKLEEIKKSIKDFETNINQFIEETSKEDAFIQYSIDDKGYIWIAKSLVEKFDKILNTVPDDREPYTVVSVERANDSNKSDFNPGKDFVELIINKSNGSTEHTWVKEGYVDSVIESYKNFSFEKYDNIFAFTKYNGEKPIEKMIGQTNYGSKYTEYAYIPIYDLYIAEWTDNNLLTANLYYKYCEILFDAFANADRVVKEE